MKLFLPFFLFFAISHSLFSQKDKTIYIIIKDIVELPDSNYDEYNIYLQKENHEFATKRLKLKTKQRQFSLKLSAKELKKFRYLHFETSISLKTIALKNIISDSLQVQLEELPIRLEKPAIYLYPIQTQKIQVKLDFKGTILNTYPIYQNGWNVIAQPNGELLNESDKRKYNYLFWDGVYSFPIKHFQYETGFVVKKENIIDFLQEKLSHIGLNQTEINDFIVYWLPELSKNEFSFVYFRINDNIDNTAFLNVIPKPDTQIRVFMEFKKLENPIKIPEQKLPKFERKGFTLVEWGGSTIDNLVNIK